jgi:thiamine biosynthesis lipoprotein
MRHRFTFRAMAAEHEILVDADDSPALREAVDAAIADVHRIEGKYSRYRDDSVVTAINRAAGRREVAIDAETASLLRYADQCFRLSGGRFDVTSGVLRRVWDFKAQPPRLPEAAAVEATLALVGWNDVAFEERTVRLPRAGMEIDFGGIGKEYAADRAATILADHGIAHALVNLGGDVRALGGQASGAPWRIGIQHPRRPEPLAIASVELRDGAVATSGDYQRGFDLDGRRYCHLLDPRTGWPVDAWQSMSVLAPLAVVAGSLATIGMLLAEDAGAFLVAQGCAWLGIDRHGMPRGTLAAGLRDVPAGAG